MSFITVKADELQENFFHAIGNQWMLITAGNSDSYNTMTASWGGVGVLWNKDVAFSFVRDSRYTMEFLDREEYYTLSFFGDNMRKELAFCGANSGRDVDKAKVTGLIPCFDEKAPYFEQAEPVLVCKKLYKQKMTPDCFVDRSIINSAYSSGDWHEVFVGEIVKAIRKA